MILTPLGVCIAIWIKHENYTLQDSIRMGATIARSNDHVHVPAQPRAVHFV